MLIFPAKLPPALPDLSITCPVFPAVFSASYNSFNALPTSPDSGIILRYCMPSFKTFTALMPGIADNAASAASPFSP
ncbi:hypothetical protein [Pectinatus frisingensis]|uniref:hypothetical protein n=1 Tax=Pectinatus frisingensis TaxID=865 RepID=UPI003D804DBC